MSEVTRGALQSMTGYGRAAKASAMGSITVELRSTNHRYLEIDHRLPNGLLGLQGRVAEVIRGGVRRGRVEVSVSIQSTQWGQRRVTFDDQLLQRYHAALLELKSRFGLKGPVTLEQLLALPQAIAISEDRVPVERLWEPFRRTVQEAVRELVQARRREGATLVVDIRRQLQTIEQCLRAVKQRLPKALEAQRRRLREQLRVLLGPAETAGAGARLEQAAALVKDVDVHEELVRLESHLTHVRQALTSGKPVGKQLDFIAQELMREANTLSAKVNDPTAVQHVVQIKGCIEKIREQVQNLE